MHKTLKQSTYLSILAYQHPADIEAIIKPDYDNFNFIENKYTDTQAFICEDNENIFVNIRGTQFDNLNDWFTNLQCEIIYPFGEFKGVHKGFYLDADSIYHDIVKILNQSSPLKNTIFGGHSQGAAVANMLALKLHYTRYFDELNLIESPRCMNEEMTFMFGSAHGSKINRVVNNNDIVCRVPPRVWGYRHIHNAKFHYFKENGEYVTEISNWDLFLDRVNGRLQDLLEFGADGLKDHCGDTVLGLVDSVEI